MPDVAADGYPIGPSLAGPRLSSAELLTFLRANDRKNHFFLQATDRRLTIHAQQTRALNLVFSLFDKGQIAAGAKVAVVGGGFAGLTAAVASASLGCEVVVLEARSELLHLQSGSDTRWVHPHIYDWPDEVANVPNTDLPFLNWTTSTASEVADRVLLDFMRHEQRLAPRLTVEYSAAVELTKGSKITIEGTARTFDCVILATGFGIERTRRGVPFRSYWMCDSLHQAGMNDPAGPMSYLISGTGDGGLIDLLRVRLRGFRHDRLASELFDDASTSALTALKVDLRALRREILSSEPRDRDARLQAAYEGFERSAGFGEISERVQDRIRTDTTAYLHGKEETFLSANASILHTFVAHVLARQKGFKYFSKEIKSAVSRDGQWDVEFDDGSTIRVQEIVVRHGPELPKGTVAAAVAKFRNEFQSDRMLGLERTAARVENNTNEWWYSRGVPRPSESRTPTASQQREQMTSSRRSSALLEESVTLQRNAFVSGAISDFICGPLYDAYYDLVYAYTDDQWDAVRQIVSDHFGTGNPISLFDRSQDASNREACWRSLQQLNTPYSIGSRRYHPAFFQTSEEERRLDQILEYFDVLGGYYIRGLIKREDLDPLLAYLHKISSRKVISYYLEYLKVMWNDGRGKKVEPRLPYSNLRGLISKLGASS